jgi:hypothetical protein
MVEFLDSVTLQKLVDDQLAKGVQIEDKPASAPQARHLHHAGGQADPRQRAQLGVCAGQRISPNPEVTARKPR